MFGLGSVFFFTVEWMEIKTSRVYMVPADLKQSNTCGNNINCPVTAVMALSDELALLQERGSDWSPRCVRKAGVRLNRECVYVCVCLCKGKTSAQA